MISVCVAVYRVHDTPNVAALGESLPAALGGHDGELVTALNGVEAAHLGLPPSARTLDLGINRGVAPAWNAAARAAAGEVLVFCNDDVELGAGALARLAEPLLRDHDPAVLGPVGANWDIAQGKHLASVGPDDASREDLAECDAVSGFLFACRKQTWEAVGGFDEFYAPASWEEIDFCTAVRAIGGHCYAVAGVPHRHEWGVSRRQPPWARARWEGRSETWRSIHRRNRRHFLEKWAEHPIPATSAVSHTHT
jgi:GT2 family glycosyltransferase